MKNRFLKNSIGILLILCMLFPLIMGCGKKDIAFTTGLSRKEIMKIDGQSFSVDEANVILLNLQREYEGLFGSDGYSKKISDKTLEEYIKNQAVEQMSQIEGLSVMAEKQGIVLSNDQKENVSKACDDYMGNIDESVAKELGITKEAVKSIYNKYCLANCYYQSKIESIDSEISDDEARIISIQYMFFSTKKTDENGNSVDVSTEEMNEINSKIMSALERINSGENFEKVAIDVSDDTTVSIDIARGEWDEAAEKAAFALTNEQVSDLVQGEKGIYIIKCISNYDEEKTLINKQKIYKENCENLLNDEYNHFMSGVLTEFNDDLWDKKSLIMNENIIKLPDLFGIYRNYIPLPEVEIE